MPFDFQLYAGNNYIVGIVPVAAMLDCFEYMNCVKGILSLKVRYGPGYF